MKQTFEKLIGEITYSQHCSDMIEVIPKSEVIELMKQVRFFTLQECAKKADTTQIWLQDTDPTEGFYHTIVDEDSILNLDPNSIEIDG